MRCDRVMRSLTSMRNTSRDASKRSFNWKVRPRLKFFEVSGSSFSAPSARAIGSLTESTRMSVSVPPSPKLLVVFWKPLWASDGARKLFDTAPRKAHCSVSL
ncbi:hypothetical protein D3C78_1661030 [compost metagenome]